MPRFRFVLAAPKTSPACAIACLRGPAHSSQRVVGPGPAGARGGRGMADNRGQLYADGAGIFERPKDLEDSFQYRLAAALGFLGDLCPVVRAPLG